MQHYQFMICSYSARDLVPFPHYKPTPILESCCKMEKVFMALDTLMEEPDAKINFTLRLFG